jgi:hypothetical protein
MGAEITLRNRVVNSLNLLCTVLPSIFLGFVTEQAIEADEHHAVFSTLGKQSEGSNA